jgi:hypothetical protein
VSTLCEVLFDVAIRGLRRLGLLGQLIGLPLILYVEIPVETGAAQRELEEIARHAHIALNQEQLKAPTRAARRGAAWERRGELSPLANRCRPHPAHAPAGGEQCT